MLETQFMPSKLDSPNLQAGGPLILLLPETTQLRLLQTSRVADACMSGSSVWRGGDNATRAQHGHVCHASEDP